MKQIRWVSKTPMKKITLKPPTDSIFNSSVVFSRAWKSTYQRSVNFLSAPRVNTTCFAGLTHARVLVRTRAGNESAKQKKAAGDVDASRGISRQVEGAPERRPRPWYCVPINFSRQRDGEGEERGGGGRKKKLAG